MFMTTRPAAVAGSFYPANAGQLRHQISQWLATPQPQDDRQLKGLILPHAGYYYSGAIAASGVRLLQPGDFSRVLILCPAHRVMLSGMAIPEFHAFATPLGEVTVDQPALAAISQLPQVQRRNDAHALEHAIEVQLPLFQQALGEFSLLPIVVGATPPAAVAAVIEQLVDHQTLLLVSTDLSHYHHADDAEQLDQLTLRQILALATDLDGHQACGCYALNGALLWARHHGYHPRLLAQCHSGDISGERQQVVGYAALALS